MAPNLNRLSSQTACTCLMFHATSFHHRGNAQTMLTHRIVPKCRKIFLKRKINVKILLLNLILCIRFWVKSSDHGPKHTKFHVTVMPLVTVKRSKNYQFTIICLISAFVCVSYHCSRNGSTLALTKGTFSLLTWKPLTCQDIR